MEETNFETRILLVPGKDESSTMYYDVPVSDDIETLNSPDLPKGQQYWKRDISFPDFFFDYNPHLSDKSVCRINASKTNYKSGKLVTLSVEDTIELVRLVARERERMRTGVYLWNNGKKIYLPGFYYGALQWGKMFGVKENGGYGKHLKYQRMLSYVRDMAITIPALRGYYNHKAKKTGITQLITIFLLIEGVINKQFTATAMSKVLDTAKKANFKYYLYALKNLPAVMRPMIEQNGWQRAVQKIEFKSVDPALSLDNTFATVSTTVDGLDGYPLIQRIHIDEPPKFPKAVPIDQVYEKSKEQVVQQGTKFGIIEMTSYPPEEDSDAFRWCRSFYQESCKIVNGMPLNGMIPFFIGIIEGSMHLADIYGEPDLEAAELAEDVARRKCKNAYEIQARQRQYSKTAKEGWQSGGGGSVYNNNDLTERQILLEEEYVNGELNYVEGNLEWSGGRFSPVRFVPLTFEDRMKKKIGKWKIYCDLDYLADKTNLAFAMPRKIKYVDGERKFLLQPSDITYFAGGTDPVDYAYVTELGKTFSLNASIIKNMNGDTISVYHHREEDPDTTIEDFLLELCFFGHYALYEGNRKHVFTTMEKEGMSFFMLMRNKKGVIVPFMNDAKENYKPVCSSTGLISTYVSLIVKRLKQNPEQFKSVPTIKQLKEFDPTETQSTDLAVTEGLAEISLDAVQSWITSKKSKYGKYAALGAAMGAI